MASGQYMSVKGPSRDAMFRRPAGWSEADNPPRRQRGNLEGDNRVIEMPSRPKPPKKGREPIATTGQPTVPGRGFPSGSLTRDIVRAKMEKLRKTSPSTLARQPVDTKFSM